MAFDNSFANFAVTMSDISKFCMGKPNFLCFFIEINNIITEVVLLFMGHILNMVEIELVWFPVT